jgi:hypothetical protein
MQCDLRVAVALACVPFGTGSEIKFLVSKQQPCEMPTTPAVPGEEPLQTTSDFLRRLVGVGARMGDKGWVEMRLGAVVTLSVDPWSILLVYGGMVPEELAVREEGYEWKTWTSLGRQGAADPLHLKNMLMAAQKI